jgi:hypothetical protein
VIRDAIVTSEALLYRLAPARLALADVFSTPVVETDDGESEKA